MTDEELIRLIKDKPDEGVQAAIKCYGPLVKGVMIKIAGYEQSVDIQEGIAQVFVRLWQYRERFDGEKGTLKSYLVAMARNEALRMLKAGKRHQESVDEALALDISLDMTHELTRKINRKIIQDVVGELGEPDRQIFIRRYFWGERIKIIALELALEEKFVENRIYLVKKKMKKQLLERGIIL